MEFSRQEYLSGLPFPSLGDLPKPGIEPTSLESLALAGGFFTTEDKHTNISDTKLILLFSEGDRKRKLRQENLGDNAEADRGGLRNPSKDAFRPLVVECNSGQLSMRASSQYTSRALKMSIPFDLEILAICHKKIIRDGDKGLYVGPVIITSFITAKFRWKPSNCLLMGN